MSSRCAAVVLAGGQSRRFGSDKLNAVVTGRSLLDRAIEGLPDDATVIVVGPPRPTARPVRFVREQPAGGGPAAGLVTGLSEALSLGAEQIVVLPGDAPAAGRAAVLLLGQLVAAPGVAAVVATDATGFDQPLQLALQAAGAAALVEAAGPSRADGGSARALVNRLTPPAVRYQLPPAGHFDIDTPEQLRAWSLHDGPVVRRILSAIDDERTETRPMLLALDGASGTGKSLLAAALALSETATVIHGDDFYSPVIATLTPEQREQMSNSEVARTVFDWRRLRLDVLEPLLRGERVRYRRYDWSADDGTLGAQVDASPADLLILEGVYSARPELADLVDLAVYLEADPQVRERRLLARGNPAEWRSFWQRGEDYYFAEQRPPSTFDLVV